MRRHGWGGSPPGDEVEAREWILDAAVRCLDRDGPAVTSISAVATELGVTRPTIYRYFPGSDELLAAVADRAHRGFRAELIARNVTLLRRDLDWAAMGYALDQLDELVEVMHRMIVSLIVAPPGTPRPGGDLRDFLRRWLGPRTAANPR
ncbi:DNA-binding transcriptional regulator, AcrR family [Frankia sp. AiPs1]|uniref:TetR/AcrR family transcriptional regulator n=1 Tax=Frankia sp. AiPa1 TaxID=573492 RepID=UPI00202B42D1|nr:TetR/AcrR family transcriptional regulator [Frankia sp. AiPa1]MCL9759631.1 TetR/AcrR family transcriptional regulator [Frankia sp. AiPa1]